MDEQTNTLLYNIKKLQDLKFEIYNRSFHKLDFHSFELFTLKINENDIDLSIWYSKYKSSKSIPEIAKMIVDEYKLQTNYF